MVASRSRQEEPSIQEKYPRICLHFERRSCLIQTQKARIDRYRRLASIHFYTQSALQLMFDGRVPENALSSLFQSRRAVFSLALRWRSCYPTEHASRTRKQGDRSPHETYQILAIQPQKPTPRTRTRAQRVRRARKLATPEYGHSRGEDVLLIELERKLLVRRHMRFNGAGKRGVRMWGRERCRCRCRRRRRRL